MHPTLLLLFSLVAISMAFYYPEDRCGPHSEFLECGTCKPDCDQPRLQCNETKCLEAGCHCVRPFVLHGGECIIPTECPRYLEYKEKEAQKKIRECPKNEVYMEDGDCEGTCSQPSTFLCNRNSWGAGCFCPTPFVRHDGKCIKQEKCPGKKLRKCPKNEEYSDCMEEERTCSNLMPLRGFCLGEGCNCKAPFVRHQGKCIKLEKCPRKMLAQLLMAQNQ